MHAHTIMVNSGGAHVHTGSTAAGGASHFHTIPSDPGHTPFGNIYYSQSPDLKYWGRHRFVMGTRRGWQSTKIGAGPVPIETSEGWLLFYHGVLTSCNGFVYSFGAALFPCISHRHWDLATAASPARAHPAPVR